MCQIIKVNVTAIFLSRFLARRWSVGESRLHISARK